jgi:hypothetical protein
MKWIGEEDSTAGRTVPKQRTSSRWTRLPTLHPRYAGAATLSTGTSLLWTSLALLGFAELLRNPHPDQDQREQSGAGAKDAHRNSQAIDFG